MPNEEKKWRAVERAGYIMETNSKFPLLEDPDLDKKLSLTNIGIIGEFLVAIITEINIILVDAQGNRITIPTNSVTSTLNQGDYIIAELDLGTTSPLPKLETCNLIIKKKDRLVRGAVIEVRERENAPVLMSKVPQLINHTKILGFDK